MHKSCRWSCVAVSQSVTTACRIIPRRKEECRWSNAVEVMLFSHSTKFLLSFWLQTLSVQHSQVETRTLLLIVQQVSFKVKAWRKALNFYCCLVTKSCFVNFVRIIKTLSGKKSSAIYNYGWTRQKKKGRNITGKETELHHCWGHATWKLTMTRTGF